MSKRQRYTADPGRDGIIKQYVEWTLERNALRADEEMYARRGDHVNARTKARQAEQFEEALLNYSRETGWGIRDSDEAHAVLDEIAHGATIVWRPRSGAVGAYEHELDPDQERMLNEVVLVAVNEGKFYPNRPKDAVEYAIKTYIKYRTEAMHEDGRAIREAAIREVHRQWHTR